MTTIAEIKQWTRPILAEHPDLALKPRMLYLRPVRHIHRSIFFTGSSDRAHPKPWANYKLLFGPPSGPQSDNWDHELLVGWSTDPQFQHELETSVRETLDEFLRPVGTIEGLYARMGEPDLAWSFKADRLSNKPILYAVVLAALGRLQEAAAIAQNYIDVNEGPLLRQAEAFEATRGKRLSLSKPIPLDVSYFLKPMTELKRLIALLTANDRRAIAAMLHEWEQHGARRRGIEDVWEPTPFPLERDF